MKLANEVTELENSPLSVTVKPVVESKEFIIVCNEHYLYIYICPLLGGRMVSFLGRSILLC